MTGLQNADATSQRRRYDPKFAIVAGRNQCKEGVVDLTNILNIITVVHVWERLQKVPQVRVPRLITELVLLLDERSLNLDFIGG